MEKVVLIILAIAAVIGLGSVYTVKQTEQVLILRFGEPVRVINGTGVEEPGLHFKRPYMFETVIRLDKRVLDLNAEPREVIASDQKRLIVDAFAKYRIVDPLKFFQTVRNEKGARLRLNSVLDSRLREVVGNVPLTALLTEGRAEIMQKAQDELNKEASGFGLDVVDVRIMRADLPKENSQKIYKRMQTEREREAKEFRAQGAEIAQRISSTAEKERTVLLAEARKKANIMRGEGDAEATRIFAESFGKDEEFYAFFRSLEAYKETLKGKDTTMVLSPDSTFLRYFGNIDGDLKQ